MTIQQGTASKAPSGGENRPGTGPLPRRAPTGRRGLLLVLSAPSGTGKTTVAARLLDRHGGTAGRLQRSVSVTTRPPRPGEVNRRDSRFVTEEQFADLAARGQLLGQAELYGHRYGTPRRLVERRLERGVDVLLVVDDCGRAQVARTHRPDRVSVFLLPPSRQELEQRLRGRTEDDEGTIARRLASARNEIARCAEYDHVLVNSDLDRTVESLEAILGAERIRYQRPALPAGQ
jgi:guanylate kinase